jgi:dTDP-D-glucose 4,6-dehydratase
MIAQIFGFEGQIQWYSSKPDGTPRKLLDTTKINVLGLKPEISLREGISTTYKWFIGKLNLESVCFSKFRQTGLITSLINPTSANRPI